MLLSSRHTEELVELRRQLPLKFTMKNLGPAHHILGMKITRIEKRDSCICLSPITSDEFGSDSACTRLDLL